MDEEEESQSSSASTSSRQEQRRRSSQETAADNPIPSRSPDAAKKINGEEEITVATGQEGEEHSSYAFFAHDKDPLPPIRGRSAQAHSTSSSPQPESVADASSVQEEYTAETKEPLPPIASQQQGSVHSSPRVSPQQESERQEETNDVSSPDANIAVTETATVQTTTDYVPTPPSRPRITQSFRRENDEEPLDVIRSDPGLYTNPYHRAKASQLESKLKPPTMDDQTQTDWSWLEDMEFIMKTKQQALLGHVSDSTKADMHDAQGPRAPTETKTSDVRGMESELTFASNMSVPFPNRDDEYGIPILNLDSASEDSDGESDILYKHDDVEELDDPGLLPAVGPPEIIKYQKESDKKTLGIDGPSEDDLAVAQLLKEQDKPFQGLRTSGYKIEKPPKPAKKPKEKQDKGDSDTEVELETRTLSVGEFEKPSSSERAFEASSTTGGAFEGECEFCHGPIKPFPTLEDQKLKPPEELYCCSDYKDFIKFMVQHPVEKAHSSDKHIDIKPHAPYGSKKARRAAKEKAMERMRMRELQRQQAAAAASGMLGGGHGGRDTGGGGANYYQFARQMKTINYQLSSQKCMEDGWTIRPVSPQEDDDVNYDEIFEPEPVLPPWAHGNRYYETQRTSDGMIRKFYSDGRLFVVLYGDGTGTVYYHSGRHAINISSSSPGLFTYIVQEDTDEADIRAVFEPNGVSCVYFSNGMIRLLTDAVTGADFHASGSRRRRWTWHDWRTRPHVHAPPLQPIILSVLPGTALRINNQEHMTLTFSCKSRRVRFQIGTRLRMVNDYAIEDKIDEDVLYRQEVANRVEVTLNKVSNLLKYPHSPKLNKLPIPTPLSSRIHKLEEIREENFQKKASKKDPNNKLEESQQQPVVVVN